MQNLEDSWLSSINIDGFEYQMILNKEDNFLVSCYHSLLGVSKK